MNWAFGKAVFNAMTPEGERTERSRWLVRAAVVVDLGVLAYFKYVNFFLSSFTERLSSIGVHVSDPTISVILPIGISFFTFQAISYVIDIGRGVWRKPVAAARLRRLPLVLRPPRRRADRAGQRVRPPARRAGPTPASCETSEAFMLIFRGLFKKVVISSYMATIVDPVFALPNSASRWEVLWAIYAYAIQIYADFSGYTDMAIGIALLLGIRFPQNFDAPYISLSVQEFWRRWHMTLSRWLRDYLYIPLGGNRGTRVVHLPQPVPDHGHRRPLARRQLDLRDLGRAPGRLPGGRARS